MKIHDIREIKTPELIKQIEEERKNLTDLKFAHQLKQLTNTSKLKALKKDIAKMLTVLKERSIAEKKSVTTNSTEGAKS
ncbi:MAG TPA: 50S ribosomal protein L29 [Ignavibacteriaceae bacterium]|uniref:Large ribosomal subunit protein uL29 n=3 Tax=environmental samples TaxID=1645731 RepID=A0A0H4T7A5_9BACT|nr:50S ribosomal protein L29, large subunit ribosomal protein L29 [uncultured Ignavibacteria bacterium Rifle_16ft_4_minimus_38491]AKQ05409.1 50S ribosomal protein L29, large subunit ribosomal protein L29 [uncultured Ignavibacteria bacterium Rifle_16ft_4_minimus_32691]AKQ05480.1 50S ribosomal protein L29, large subunit ribosomal protein L29 [uncultured Ignavibacteria bacterium Rifle_16ft_4_minimus_332]OGU82000.1 MAG: 50S ribosomal protein L29 [Ignavibacteria bacterium RBG_16_35_7]